MKLGKGLYTFVLGMSLWRSLASGQINLLIRICLPDNFVPVFTNQCAAIR
jgi:hypothetical protein